MTALAPIAFVVRGQPVASVNQWHHMAPRGTTCLCGWDDEVESVAKTARIWHPAPSPVAEEPK
jgi:hypothetical protein